MGLDTSPRRTTDRGVLCKEPAVKYAFIHEEQYNYSISRLCEVLEVRRSGYYEWLNGPAARRRLYCLWNCLRDRPESCSPDQVQLCRSCLSLACPPWRLNGLPTSCLCVSAAGTFSSLRWSKLRVRHRPVPVVGKRSAHPNLCAHRDHKMTW